MDITDLRHFLAVADEGHYSRAANAQHVSKATVQASVTRLQEELDEVLVAVDDEGEVTLTEEGVALRNRARAMVAKAPDPVAAKKAGGKAKASKGKGRAPIVKGEPKPYKKRQGR